MARTYYDISLYNSFDIAGHWSEWKYDISYSCLDLFFLKKRCEYKPYVRNKIVIKVYKDRLDGFATTLFENIFEEQMSLDAFITMVRSNSYILKQFGLIINDEENKEE